MFFTSKNTNFTRNFEFLKNISWKIKLISIFALLIFKFNSLNIISKQNIFKLHIVSHDILVDLYLNLILIPKYRYCMYHKTQKENTNVVKNYTKVHYKSRMVMEKNNNWTISNVEENIQGIVTILIDRCMTKITFGIWRFCLELNF